MDLEIRRILAEKSILWCGNLEEDCSALWAGLTLRAKKMSEGNWWWAVRDQENPRMEIDDSKDHKESCTNDKTARENAEKAAKSYVWG